MHLGKDPNRPHNHNWKSMAIRKSSNRKEEQQHKIRQFLIARLGFGKKTRLVYTPLAWFSFDCMAGLQLYYETVTFIHPSRRIGSFSMTMRRFRKTLKLDFYVSLSHDSLDFPSLHIDAFQQRPMHLHTLVHGFILPHTCYVPFAGTCLCIVCVCIRVCAPFGCIGLCTAFLADTSR